MSRTWISIKEEEEKNGNGLEVNLQDVTQSKVKRQTINGLLEKTYDTDKSLILNRVAGITERKDLPEIRDGSFF